MKTTIPFEGFYCSVHAEAVDRAIEYAAEINDKGDSNSIIVNELRGHVDFGEVFDKYSSDYTQELAVFLKVNLKFDELSRPREYNFITDRIFASISELDFRKLYNSVDKIALGNLVSGRFTSRSGFISYYSSNFTDWPDDIAQWDHNQAGTVLELAAIERDWDEGEYACEVNDSGSLDNWLDAAMDERGQRLLRIASYLRERDARLWRSVV